MDDRGRLGWAIAIGAVVGGALGYLFFTEGGRRLRAQIEPRLADLLEEAQKWQGTLDQVRHVAMGQAGLGDAWGDDQPGGPAH